MWVGASSPCGQQETTQGTGMREKDAIALLFKRHPFEGRLKVPVSWEDQQQRSGVKGAAALTGKRSHP